MIDRRSFLVGAVSTGTAAAFGVDAFGPLSGIRSTSGAKRPLALVYRGQASSPGIPVEHCGVPALH
jgi:hypothetical protein